MKAQKLVSKLTQIIFNEHMQHNSHTSRLCGDLTQLCYHESKMEKTNNERICVYCGEPCISRCTLCPGMPYMHFNPVRGPRKGYKCFYHHHNNAYFGLGRNDMSLLGKSKKEWKRPTDSQIRANRRHTNKLLENYKSNK